MDANNQPTDITVMVRTLLRPSLLAAVRSIYRQDFPGRVQVLLGIDAAADPLGLVEILRAECPERMRLDVLDLGYPTSVPRGGLYTAREGGVLATLLAYAAKSRHVLFLDDDNWAAPDHLSTLFAAVQGFDWAFCRRWFVDPQTLSPICVDVWESVGPGHGVFAAKAGGFVDPNCLMFDKLACHFAIPWLAVAMYPDFTGHDRMFFDQLRRRNSVGWSGKATVYYVTSPLDGMDAFRQARFAEMT